MSSAWNVLGKELEKSGVIHAKYGVNVGLGPEVQPDDILMAGQFCAEWEARLNRPDWMTRDYVVMHLLTRSEPLSFARLYALMDRGALTPEQTESHQISREIGMRHGVAIPLRDGTPTLVGGISMEADRGFTDQGFSRHLAQVLPKIRQLVELFHSAIRRDSLLDRENRLSSRERECLLWLTRGLRVQQIAHCLGTHPKTVEKQLANARRKLKARTNNQAVMRALILNLLEV